MPARWPRTTATRRPLPEVVRALRRCGHGDAIAFGGVRFARALATSGLVDEYQFYVNPTAVGAGDRVLGAGTRLDLVAARGYPCGIVATRYRPRVTG